METAIKPLESFPYSGNGNITSKYDGGTYGYDPTKVHAVTSVTKTAGTVSQTLQDISYTTFNKAAMVQQNTPVTNKHLSYAITYGPDEQRIKTVYSDTLGGITTRFYAGSYEKEVTATGTRQIHYINAGNGLAAVYIIWSTG